MIKAPPTPKGFRDINPALAKKRRSVIGKIVEVLEEAGFVPLETPTIEFAQTLLGKYGEEERLIYQFTDRGGRKLALRYDLTVPLARFVASNLNLIARAPFRRYQVGQVFRGENPQKGRWREFTQLDFDTVGSSDLKEDAKIVATTLRAAKSLGVNNPVLYLNDRKNFQGLPKKAVVAIDKLEKIGTDAVIKEMAENGLTKDEAGKIVEDLKNQKPTQDIETIFKLAQEMGYQEEELKYSPTLARGLDYYTGVIFELRAPAYGNLSIGAGGRYDNLIGSFCKKEIPAVGFSFGFDRLIEAMDELNLFPTNITSSPTKVLVTIFSKDLLSKSLETASSLKNKGIAAELYLDENTPLEKQLKYADQKGIPYIAILGPNEVSTGEVTVKNLTTGEQKRVKQEEITQVFQD